MILKVTIVLGMDIENVKVDWAPVLESQISQLEEKLPGRGIRETFQRVIQDLNENRIRSRLIVSGNAPAGYAYYIQPEKMTDRILGNVGFVDEKAATGDRAKNLIKWLLDEGKSGDKTVMINEIFNGTDETERVLQDSGFTRMDREMMELNLTGFSQPHIDLQPGYEITGLTSLNIEEYIESESASYTGSEDEILLPGKKEEKRDFVNGIFGGSYGKVITDVSRVVKHNGKLAGACIITAGNAEAAAIGYPLIVDVFVKHEHRGKGVARALMVETLRRAEAANIYRIFLWVNLKSDARDLYASLGFRPSDYPKEIIYYRKP